MKNVCYSFIVLLMLLGTACDKSDVTKTSDEQQADNLELKQLRISFIEYGALPENSVPRFNKFFTLEHPAKDYIPTWLNSKKYNTADGSSAVVSYDFINIIRPESIKKIETPVFELSTENYQTVWGKPFVDALTPEKSPEIVIPTVLKSMFPEATAGDCKVVKYNYSPTEPTLTKNALVTYVNETFTSIESDAYTDRIGWMNIATQSARRWWVRIVSNTDKRMMSSANELLSIYKADTWLISKELDLTSAINPILSFDVAAGYYTVHCLSVLVSDSFKEVDNPVKSEWTDISDLCNIPMSGPRSYGNLQSSGEISLIRFAGKKVRIAFRYTGSVDPELGYSTTYEIDNVKVREIRDLFSVSRKNAESRFYIFDGYNWVAAGTEYYMLSPEDYTSLNVPYLEKRYVNQLLVPFLKKKFPAAVEGTKKIIVFQDGSEVTAADEFLFTNGTWSCTTLPETVVKEDKYLYDAGRKQWSFAE